MSMPASRYPAMVFGCVPDGGKRKRGRPKGTYRHTHTFMLKRVDVGDPRKWLDGMRVGVQDRVSWRAEVKGFETPAPATSARQRTRPYLGLY